MNVHELKEKDPSGFQKEYEKWAQYALDYKWWDSVRDDFIEDCKPKGVRVDQGYFSLTYGQGDYAAFEGTLRLHEVMEHLKLAEPYPALYLAVKENGARVEVSCHYHNRSRIGEVYAGLTYCSPRGIFSDLDKDTWDALIEQQLEQSSLEEVLQSFVDGLCTDLYKSLRDEYEYLTSEEQFIEHCEANEIEFEGEEE